MSQFATLTGVPVYNPNHGLSPLSRHWRSAPHLLCPLPEDYRELCPCFTSSEAEEAARDFDLLEMVQATFYAMLFNDAMELIIVSGFIVVDL